MSYPVYSLPKEDWIDAAALPAILANPALSQEEFYNHCVKVFPVVLDRMAPEEISALRLQNPDQADRDTATRMINVTDLMRANANWMNLKPMDVSVPSIVVPVPCPGVPLAGRWLALGQTLYGLQPKAPFFYREVKAMRRPAAPDEQVVGQRVHGDSSLADGFVLRTISVLSLCADPELDEPSLTPELGRPWWTTRWNDMRNFDYDSFMFDDHRPIEKRYNDPMHRMLLAGQCPERPMPANCHIAMPSWMLHIAGGITDVPEGVIKGELGPKAYVSHAMLHRPIPKPKPHP